MGLFSITWWYIFSTWKLTCLKILLHVAKFWQKSQIWCENHKNTRKSIENRFETDQNKLKTHWYTLSSVEIHFETPLKYTKININWWRKYIPSYFLWFVANFFCVKLKRVKIMPYPSKSGHFTTNVGCKISLKLIRLVSYQYFAHTLSRFSQFSTLKTLQISQYQGSSFSEFKFWVYLTIFDKKVRE